MGLYHGWDDEADSHADFVRGGVDAEDFFAVPRHRKKSRKKAPKKKRGCPENDFGPHVYVWVPTRLKYDWWPEYGVDDFYKKHGFYRRKVKTCCGCGKTNGSRYTEEMKKLISKKGWYNANYGD